MYPFAFLFTRFGRVNPGKNKTIMASPFRNKGWIFRAKMKGSQLVIISPDHKALFHLFLLYMVVRQWEVGWLAIKMMTRWPIRNSPQKRLTFQVGSSWDSHLPWRTTEAFYRPWFVRGSDGTCWDSRQLWGNKCGRFTHGFVWPWHQVFTKLQYQLFITSPYIQAHWVSCKICLIAGDS